MPDSSDYLRILADAEAKTESASWPAAAALWARVVALNPVIGRHWAYLAEARYEAEDFRGALDAYAQAEQNGVWIRGRQELETINPPPLRNSAGRSASDCETWTGRRKTSTGSRCSRTRPCVSCSGSSMSRI